MGLPPAHAFSRPGRCFRPASCSQPGRGRIVALWACRGRDPFAYRDVVGRVRLTAAAGKLGRAAAWHGPLGIRPIDVALTAAAVAAVELSVAVGGGYGARPLNAQAYLLGALLAVPILVRRRWPFQVLLACSALLFLYYTLNRRNISPAPLLCVPLFDAAVAGYLTWAIAIPVVFTVTGLVVVGTTSGEGLVTLASNFLPSIVILMLAVMLGEVVRSRRALAAETAHRLRLAEEERAAGAARLVAEERLRIARELHDTVAHSMATITVQAASALHLLGPAGQADDLHQALTAIRSTSKDALAEMRVTLGQLRQADAAPGAGPGPGRTAAARPASAGCRRCARRWPPPGWRSTSRSRASRSRCRRPSTTRRTGSCRSRSRTC